MENRLVERLGPAQGDDPRERLPLGSLPISPRFFTISSMNDTATALAQLESAVAEGKVSAAAAKNIRTWLTEPYLAEYAPQVAGHLAIGKWKELDDAFWTIIPFGTGGRRGRMYPIGTNAINDRTIGESARGLPIM